MLTVSQLAKQRTSHPHCAAPPPDNSGARGSLAKLRVAVVHDWLTDYAGSEKVLEQILLLFPQAELFTLVDHLPKAKRAFVNGRVIHTSFMQRLPFSARVLRPLLWLSPIAMESFDLSGFDLILSSSHAVAKGVLTGPDQLHICYCHTPMRYAWDCQSQYLQQANLTGGVRSLYARSVLHYLRHCDLRSVPGVDHFIANSHFIARRISKIYARPAHVIHPPVAIDKFPLTLQKSDYYVTSSRLVPYKRVDLIVEAFAGLPERRLIVVGDGPEMAKCRRLATSNVRLLGYQPDETLSRLLGKARAFLFAAEEDFGISPVEAQACGTPVLCYGKGGVRDSVLDRQTGLYFHEQSAASIVDAVRRFESSPAPFDFFAIHAQAQRFSPQRFRTQFESFVAARWQDHCANGNGPLPKAPETLAMGA